MPRSHPIFKACAPGFHVIRRTSRTSGAWLAAPTSQSPRAGFRACLLAGEQYEKEHTQPALPALLTQRKQLSTRRGHYSPGPQQRGPRQRRALPPGSPLSPLKPRSSSERGRRVSGPQQGVSSPEQKLTGNTRAAHGHCTRVGAAQWRKGVHAEGDGLPMPPAPALPAQLSLHCPLKEPQGQDGTQQGGPCDSSGTKTETPGPYLLVRQMLRCPPLP